MALTGFKSANAYVKLNISVRYGLSPQGLPTLRFYVCRPRIPARSAAEAIRGSSPIASSSLCLGLLETCGASSIIVIIKRLTRARQSDRECIGASVAREASLSTSLLISSLQRLAVCHRCCRAHHSR